MTRHAQEFLRPLPVVLRPRSDELLSSWLTRHAAYYGVTRRRLLDHVGISSPSVEALDREITLGQRIHAGRLLSPPAVGDRGDVL